MFLSYKTHTEDFVPCCKPKDSETESNLDICRVKKDVQNFIEDYYWLRLQRMSGSRGKTFLGSKKAPAAMRKSQCAAGQQRSGGNSDCSVSLPVTDLQATVELHSSSLPKWSTLPRVVRLKGLLFVCDMALPVNVTVTNLVS